MNCPCGKPFNFWLVELPDGRSFHINCALRLQAIGVIGPTYNDLELFRDVRYLLHVTNIVG